MKSPSAPQTDESRKVRETDQGPSIMPEAAPEAAAESVEAPQKLSMLRFLDEIDPEPEPSQPEQGELAMLAEERLATGGTEENYVTRGVSREALYAEKGLNPDGSKKVPEPELSPAEKANRKALKGVIKPDDWPEIMAWPPSLLLQAAKKKALSEDEIKKINAYYRAYCDKMNEQADKLARWIDDKSTATPKESLIQMRLSRHDHHGIQWATLLDVTAATSPGHQNVKRWERSVCEMMDGGRVWASKDKIHTGFLRQSEQAIEVMIAEARARGWETLEVTGNKAFCKAMAEAAKKYDMPMRINRRRHVFGVPMPLMTTSSVILPTVPFNPEDIAALKDAAKNITKGDTRSSEIIRKALESDKKSRLSRDDIEKQMEEGLSAASKEAVKMAAVLAGKEPVPAPSAEAKAAAPRSNGQKRQGRRPAPPRAEQFPLFGTDPSDPGPMPDDRSMDPEDLVFSSVPDDVRIPDVLSETSDRKTDGKSSGDKSRDQDIIPDDGDLPELSA